MTDGVMALQYSNHCKCEVCGCQIRYADFLLLKKQGYLVCHSFDCKTVMNQKARMTPMLFKFHLEFKKKLIEQRVEKEAAAKKYIKEVEVKESGENQKIIQLTLKKTPELDEKNVHLLTIPSGLSRLVTTSKKRIQNYTEHLNSIISQAIDFSESSEVVFGQQYDDVHENFLNVEKRLAENPKINTISDKLCSMCKGGCCAAGRDSAYLTVDTIRRYMDVNPGLSEKDILDSYLSNISLETVEDACINQTKTGCALPTEMRSDTCNGYYCDSLKSYQKEHAGKTDLGRVLAIQRSNTNWNRFNPDESHKIVNVVLLPEF